MLNVDRLERSFAQIKDRGPEFTKAFYSNLFTHCPEVKPLFQHVDMQEQGKRHCQLNLLFLQSSTKFTSVIFDGGSKRSPIVV